MVVFPAFFQKKKTRKEGQGAPRKSQKNTQTGISGISGCFSGWGVFWGNFCGSFRSGPECTKIAHRRSLAIFATDSGIAGNSAAGIKFVPFHRRENRCSLAISFAEQIAPLGASKIARFCMRGSGKNRRRNRRESRLISFWMLSIPWIFYPISLCRRLSRFIVF